MWIIVGLFAFDFCSGWHTLEQHTYFSVINNYDGNRVYLVQQHSGVPHSCTCMGWWRPAVEAEVQKHLGFSTRGLVKE